MYTISLDKLTFFSHHGIHGEEALTGSSFEVSVQIHFDPPSPVRSIHETVNYSDAFEIISRHMAHPVPLLELLAEKIAEEIAAINPYIRRVEINIQKRNPPIPNFQGKVGVKISRDFSPAV